MNLLLVVPRVVNKAGEFYLFPQGIAYIAAVLGKAGFSLFKLNPNHTDTTLRDLLTTTILQQDINVVLTGGLTGQFSAIRSILETAKAVRPDIITVVGGGLITSAPVYAMEALEVADFGVIGEGENIVVDLCRAIENKNSPDNISGLVYMKEGRPIVTTGRPALVDVEDLPFPDYDGFGIDNLLKLSPNIVGMDEENSFPIITSRGCPFSCTFCFHPSGLKYRQRSLDSVFSEIDSIIDRYPIRYLSIQDELFGHKMDRVRQFCERIKPYNIQWWAQFRVNDITHELVTLLRESNCAAIALGIESADNSILRSMRKKITIEQTDRALQIIHEAGLGVQGCLIFGDPAETLETAKTSLDWWKSHPQYGLQLSLIVTYPGTAIFKHALDTGLIEDPVQFIRDGCPVVKLSPMPHEEYAWLVGELLSLQRSELNTPSDCSIDHIDFTIGKMNFRGTCKSCGQANSWTDVRFFIAESLTCKNCGRRHYSPIPDGVVSAIESGIKQKIEHHGKICFWGINPYFYALSQKISPEREQLLYFVDKSEIRQGVQLPAGKISSTEIINDMNIKCIVVTTPQYFSNVLPAILREFPLVKEVISISDLLTAGHLAQQITH